MIDSALASVVEEMLPASVVVGPALDSVGIGGLDEDAYKMIEEFAHRLTSTYWPLSASLKRYPGMVVSPAIMKTCFIETLSSTAAYLSHLRLGFLNINESMTLVALRLLEKFIQDHSADNVLTVNLLVNTYDNFQLLNHYTEVRRDQFESGQLHRPWIHYSLLPELESMVDAGNVEVVELNGVEHVRLTENGRDRYRVIKEFFTETGYIQHRSTLMRWSQFSQLVDYDDLIENAFEMMAMRKVLMEHSEIRDGMHVLELGAGTGGLTIDAGLYRIVGPTGSLVATEPSLGMLNRAKGKAQELKLDAIQFVQSPAEKLPFPDNHFDAVTGNSFIFLTDIPVAMKEINRVLKPGGLFSTTAPLQFEHPPFMAEWFAPALKMLAATPRRNIATGPETITNAMAGLFDDISVRNEVFAAVYDSPENVVRYLFQVVNLFEDAMVHLPWQAKQDMVKTLIERGQEIVLKYSQEELRPLQPCQIIRARAVK